MNSQILFSGKKKKKYFSMSSAENFTQSANINMSSVQDMPVWIMTWHDKGSIVLDKARTH